MYKVNDYLHKFVWPSWLILALCMFNHSAIADRGDTLVINAEIVNLRSRPSTTSTIVKRLPIDREIIEISRYEDWVEVATNDKRLDYGWIHSDLLAKKDGSPVATPQNHHFSLFRAHFVSLVKEVENKTGVTPFIAVEQLDEGSLQLTSNEDWLSLTLDQRNNILTKVFDLWRKYVETGLSVAVEVMDEDGNQHMMMFR